MEALLDSHLVWLIGGGGKTSTMIYLAGVAKTLGYKTVITTTTHLQAPSSFPHDKLVVLGERDVLDIVGELKDNEITMIVKTVEDNGDHVRCLGLDPSTVTQLSTLVSNICIVCEADGSRGLSLKGHAEHEPNVGEGGVEVAVVGLDGLVTPLGEGNTHRSNLFSDVSGCDVGSVVTPQQLAQAITSPRGYSRRRLVDAVVLNKVDVVSGELVAAVVAALEAKGVKQVWPVSVKALLRL